MIGNDSEEMMANPNLIPESAINEWCDAYAELCKRFGLYLVMNDECWLQSAGEPRDSDEAGENMRAELLGGSGATPLVAVK